MRSVTAMVSPSSGRGPPDGPRGSSPSAAGGGTVGLTGEPPPVIAASTTAQSATVRAIGPGWSRVGARGMIPSSESRPWVGLIALVPQHAEGMRSEPHVSDPRAAGVIPAASAAALPPLDPPATRSSAHGLPT